MTEQSNRRLAAVMFTDILGYTGMVQEDEQLALRTMATHERLIKEYVQAYHGRVIKFYGDGSLSMYESAVDAVRSAIEIQKRLRQAKVPVRIGIHLGDVVLRGQDIFGNGVNIASRIEQQGIAGSILISDRVQQQLTNQKDLRTKYLGWFKLKNVKIRVPIYAVDATGILLPPKPNLFKRWQQTQKWPYYAGLLILGLSAVALVQQGKLKSLLHGDLDDVFRERKEVIAVPVFENFTGIDSLDFIAKMASHWITKGLSDIGELPVVSYESVEDERPVNMASLSSLQNFGRSTGAVNLVMGSFSRRGRDSLEFSTFVKKASTGEVVSLDVPNIYVSMNNPLPGIHAILNHLRGYWASRNLHLSSVPSYGAYRSFIAAKAAWNKDRDRAEEYLLLSIQQDSSFFDSYDLLATHYTNEGRYVEAKEALETLKRSINGLSDRQKLKVQLREARIFGDNVDAFRYSLEEYAENPQDLFANTAAMVFALESVNEPEQCLEIFDRISLDSLDFGSCSYCNERVHLGLLAHLRLDDVEEAKEIATYFPARLPSRKYFVGLIRLAARESDTLLVNQIIQRAKIQLEDKTSHRYLYYLAAECFQLLNNEEFVHVYAQKTIDAYEHRPDRTVARAYYLLGKYERSIQFFDVLIAQNPEHIANIGQRAIIQARLGNLKDAERAILTMEGLRAEFQFGDVPYQQARVYLSMGKTDQALLKLEQAIQEGCRFYYWLFENDPDLMTLFRNPRFQEIVHPSR
ncbi:MAG: hypothetical protein HKN87_21650 [Saprospiraceae bacterium]|nr:hypothetical protein [Saprospiraceae bacterium]